MDQLNEHHGTFTAPETAGGYDRTAILRALEERGVRLAALEREQVRNMRWALVLGAGGDPEEIERIARLADDDLWTGPSAKVGAEDKQPGGGSVEVAGDAGPGDAGNAGGHGSAGGYEFVAGLKLGADRNPL